MRSDDNNKSDLALVTGATGFIGRVLSQMLLHKGYQVRVLLRADSGSDYFNSDEFEIVYCELDDQAGLEKACEGVACVFHVAGIAHVGNVQAEMLNKVNVEGTRNIANACLHAGVKRLVYFSSVLAAALDADTSPTATISDYARSKKQAEELLLAAAREEFEPVILRPVNVYGPGMKGNIAGLMRRIKAGSLPPLPRLSNSLALVSVQDISAAAIRAGEAAASGGQIYVISDGQAYTPNSIESAVYAALGRKKPGWHSPRMVFYAAALGAQIANKLGIWRNDLGLRTYRSLTGESEQAATRVDGEAWEKIATELGFTPTRTFDDELPVILAALE